MSNYFCVKWSRISPTGIVPDKNIIKKDLFYNATECRKLKYTESRQFNWHCLRYGQGQFYSEVITD